MILAMQPDLFSLLVLSDAISPARCRLIVAAGYQVAGTATAEVPEWSGVVRITTFIRTDTPIIGPPDFKLVSSAPNGKFHAVKLTPADFVYPVYRGPEGDAGCDPTGASLAQEDREYVNLQCENQGLPPRFGPGAQVSGIGLFYTFHFQN